MRKTTFVRPLPCRISLFCLVALGVIWLPAFAQDAGPTAPHTKEVPAAAQPRDPKELMRLAARTNGLAGDDVKPWHLKATYQSLDEQGNVKDQGTFEEFWVSDKKFTRTLTGSSLTETEYGTEKGIMVSGPQNPPPDLLYQLRSQFVGSLQSPESIERSSYELKQHEAGKVNLDCLSMVSANGIPYGSVWCLDPEEAILRISALPYAQILHNSIIRFQERFIARDLKFTKQGRVLQTAHLDRIELYSINDEALFQPPPEASAKRLTVSIGAGVMAGMLVKKTRPEYPLYAKEARISGTVVLQAKISKTGSVEDLQVIGGPRELQNAALDAVKHWVYQPYLLNNEPVEVQTTINVIFTFGG
ncbi:MAG: energy transducer TonB [Terracidiphilus sp.]|nr:energy transducer TonB [Terracidiphilus sp.]